jgi:hypothetical protein
MKCGKRDAAATAHLETNRTFDKTAKTDPENVWYGSRHLLLPNKQKARQATSASQTKSQAANQHYKCQKHETQQNMQPTHATQQNMQPKHASHQNMQKCRSDLFWIVGECVMTVFQQR